MTARQRREWRDGLIAIVVTVVLGAAMLYSLSVTEATRACFQ